MAQINKPTDYFNTKLYTGNDTTNAITGVGHQPDLVWIKGRDTAYNHQLVDVIRGVNKPIRSNLPAAEATLSDSFNSFDSDGFTLGGDSETDSFNNSGQNYVAWNWKANGSGVSNTDGSITSTVSANTTSGFSIVKWTPTYGSAQSIGHGLGTVPKVIIQKPLDGSAADWVVGGFGLDWSGYLLLDATLAFTNDGNDSTGTGRMFSAGGTEPTANVWYTDTAAITGNATSVIAYCFAEKKGFSKFGSYTGNGNADGTFIYTGFKPAFFLWKRYNSTGAWYQSDSVRSPSNLVDKQLGANDNNFETAFGSPNIDFLSNGIKMRDANVDRNFSGGQYIFMAFAENPLVGTNNIPATAR